MSDIYIITLVFFFLSIIFIIKPLLVSFHIQLPIIGRTKVTSNLMTPIILAFILLRAVQCIPDGIVRTNDILVLFIFQAFITIDRVNNTQNLYLYSNFVLATLLPQTPLPSTPNTTAAAEKIIDDNADRDGEADENDTGAATTPNRQESGKRKPKRKKKRTKKKNKKTVDLEGIEKTVSSILSTPLATPTPSLTVSDTILGYGSQGTVVYQGVFQGRAVAVKRILQDFVKLATVEVSILQQSDDHPNIIRYHYHEEHPDYIYIALELCPASLADIIENPHGSRGGSRREEGWGHIVRDFDAKRAMKQIASGLWHLHGLGLVHRDIKPQNILISFSGRTGYRMLLSDFGLCKKLDEDQTSFLPTENGTNPAGSVGWRAPEVLCWETKLDELSTGESSRGSLATYSSNGTTTICLTKSIDIFALGCLFFYILTKGRHPYGDRVHREVNIITDNKNLSPLCSIEESIEAHDLISCMLHLEPSQRPDIQTCLPHPLFWDPTKRLSFLQDASDRFNDMCRDPKDWKLIRLERDEESVVGSDWYQKLDPIFIENLGRYRKYDGSSVRDLMRALRNKKHHYQDLPDDLKRHLGTTPEGFLGYFTRRYPRLFMYVHQVVKDTGLDRESPFKTYFELQEP